MIRKIHIAIGSLLLQLVACSAAVEPNELDAENTSTTSSALLGSDACKNTDITVVNSFFFDGKEREIRVDHVKYYSSSEGDWYNQSLDDVTLAPNKQHTWQNKDLQHAENDRLTKWRVYFKYRESDGDWSDPVYEEVNTPDVTCHANDKFTLTVI